MRVGEGPRTFTDSSPSHGWPPSAGHSYDQRNQKDYQEHKEQYLRDACSCRCDTAKSKNGGDKRNDEEYQRPVEHIVLH